MHGAQVSVRPCEGDDGHCVRIPSSRHHGIREEDGNHAAADTEPGTTYIAGRHRSSRPDVQTRVGAVVLGRP